MRARNIKPGLFKNDDLAECDPLARLLFAGLWCMADREGRMEFRPKKIKAEILPYDECNILHLLHQLQMKGFILLYKVVHEPSCNENEECYLSIPSFLNHQNPHVNEANSTIPAPDENSTSIELIGLNPSSLNPSSLNPDTRKSAPKRVRVFDQEKFDCFWKAYPKKKAKQDAIKAFTKLNPDEPVLQSILSSLELAKTSDDWQKSGGQFIPFPATWLNGRRWEDEIPTNVNQKLSMTPEEIAEWKKANSEVW